MISTQVASNLGNGIGPDELKALKDQVCQRSTERRSISVVMITQNEVKFATRAIRSCLSFADEMIVIDGGSHDDTVAQAQALGCRVYVNPWPGYAPQRILGVEKTVHEWVFMIDSDEEVGEDLQQAMLAWKNAPGLSAHAFAVDRANQFMGVWLPHHTDDQVRLFHKAHHQILDVLVHEGIVPGKAPVVKLVGTLWHYKFRNLNDQVSRFNKYTDLEAQRDFLAGQRFNLVRLLLKPPARFVQRYFWQRFFTRGLAGFIISVLWVYYDFLKEIKLYEISWRSGLIDE
jgi:glycosyltransferase involved in cell wall biosynthesis